jgi:hypothetical protein
MSNQFCVEISPGNFSGERRDGNSFAGEGKMNI